MSEVLWKDADRDLQEAVTDAEEVDVDDQRYVRLTQRSSATYFGRWGPHTVEEALYRRAGVRNGPTIKPIELRVGIIEHMTPDMARVVGELFADRSSRQVERTMKTVGIVPPSRSFLEKRGKQMAGGLTVCTGDVETEAQVAATLPAEVAAIGVRNGSDGGAHGRAARTVVAATTAAVPAQAVRAHAAGAPAAQLPDGVGRQHNVVRSSRRSSSDLPIRGRRRE